MNDGEYPPVKKWENLKMSRDRRGTVLSRFLELFPHVEGIGGRGSLTFGFEKLHDQLMSKIDTEDLMEVKEVQRYIKLLIVYIRAS